MRSSRSSRVLKGLVGATIATFVALMSHVAGGGALPGWAGIAVPLVLSVVVCIALAGRRISAVRTTIGVATSQLLFHTLFVLGVTDGSAVMTMGGHHHHGAMTMVVTEPTAAALHADPQMWLWHAFAAVVTAVALLRGERALASLRAAAGAALTSLRRLTVVVAAVVTAPPRTRLAPVIVTVRTFEQEPFARAFSRRGPPVTLTI